MKERGDLAEISDRLLRFARERDWEQFHAPKNLAMALAVEAAELMEHFQWLTEEQSARLAPKKLEAVREEIADVLIYLLRLSERLGVDPLQAAREKIRKNEARYPVHKSRGSARKYDELD